MATRTHHTREWLLLLVALAIVAGLVIPAWQATSAGETRAEFLARWTPERITKLLLGPEQVVCYLAFTWAALILLARYRTVQKQRSAFRLELLPTDEGARILPEDARPLTRKVDALTERHGASILANLIRTGLTKYAISKDAKDVAEVVRNQADIEANRLSAGLGGLVGYLAWAIPAIGFIGTVRGLAGAFGLAGSQEADIAAFTKQATDQLKIAFDCTLVALALSVLLMYLLHTVQRAEETLVIDAQEYCQEHLLLRLYDPK
jgi:biopolymer transport protein ExbB/TolQ